MKIAVYKTLRIRYQSMEDFRECEDLLRCNESFHGHRRFDSAIINATDFQYARFELLFRCHTPSGTAHDLALVRTFRRSSWKPRTVWAGCTVLEAGQATLVSLEYLTRGALVVDTDLENLQGKHYYLDDVVDNDMFLRLGN
jgi:hypothetical protein